MSNCFHLAIPAGDLNLAKNFYCNVLGCKSGNSEKQRWLDIDFWGNELTLHQSEESLPKVRHDVDMGAVLVPHFGIHLPEREFQALKARIEAAGLVYLDPPYRRFIDSEYEQETFFIADPNGNILEMKTMVNPKVLFKVESA
ncbi:glyoxalase [Colwellia sp. MT41]|uniref:VOC family protein n=1 Tax=Colwellia sp. MT41 TaxID=58049 RepID=UPI000717681C|nr:VOC family protein [Colwellia sp. MT41]ALO34870.1 glyoxalase [Colwellia sp. MT41]